MGWPNNFVQGVYNSDNELVGVEDGDGGAIRFSLRYTTGVPVVSPGNGVIGINGKLSLGNLIAPAITFSASSGAGVTCSAGASTPFVSADVNKIITIDNGKQFQITAFTNTSNVVGTILNGATLSTTSFAVNTGVMGWPLQSESATKFAGKNGAFVYFPAGALYAASAAGNYFTIFSNTTYATVYDNTLPINAIPSIPGTINPIVSPAIGAFTIPTSLLIVLCTILVPAGFLGKNGVIDIDLSATMTNLNAGSSKNFSIRFGASTYIANILFGTNATWARRSLKLVNTGVENQQFTIDKNAASDIGFGIGVNTYTELNTAIDQVLYFGVVHNNAAAQAEPLMINTISVELKPS